MVQFPTKKSSGNIDLTGNIIPIVRLRGIGIFFPTLCIAPGLHRRLMHIQGIKGSIDVGIGKGLFQKQVGPVYNRLLARKR